MAPCARDSPKTQEPEGLFNTVPNAYLGPMAPITDPCTEAISARFPNLSKHLFASRPVIQRRSVVVCRRPSKKRMQEQFLKPRDQQRVLQCGKTCAVS